MSLISILGCRGSYGIPSLLGP